MSTSYIVLWNFFLSAGLDLKCVRGLQEGGWTVLKTCALSGVTVLGKQKFHTSKHHCRTALELGWWLQIIYVPSFGSWWLLREAGPWAWHVWCGSQLFVSMSQKLLLSSTAHLYASETVSEVSRVVGAMQMAPGNLHFRMLVLYDFIAKRSPKITGKLYCSVLGSFVFCLEIHF